MISMAFAFFLGDYMNLFYFFSPLIFCPLLSLCVLANRCTMKTFTRICKSRVGLFWLSPVVALTSVLKHVHCWTQIGFRNSSLEFGPICLTVTHCQHFPVTKSYLKCQRESLPFILSHLHLLFFDHYIYHNVLKNRFEVVKMQQMRHMRDGRGVVSALFPLSWSYVSLTVQPAPSSFMEVLSFALFNNSSPNLQGGVAVEVLSQLFVQTAEEWFF